MMIIHFEKSGGFTGLRTVATVDTNELPPDQAARLLRELDESGLLDTAPEALESTGEGSTCPGAADMVNYELTLEIGSYEHTYCMTEDTMPDSLQPLLRQLTILARSSNKSDC